MASEPEWRSFNFYMNDIASHALYTFANEFERFIRNEMGKIDFFFMGEVIHYKLSFSWPLSSQLEVYFKAFQAGWFASHETMVEDIGMEGL